MANPILRKPGKPGNGLHPLIQWALARRLRLAILALVLPGLLAPLAGCTRRFFRNSADSECSTILTEKSKGTPWQLDEFNVYPDPLARFADPTNPDRPPMPPDDPAARDF